MVKSGPQAQLDHLALVAWKPSQLAAQRDHRPLVVNSAGNILGVIGHLLAWHQPRHRSSMSNQRAAMVCRSVPGNTEQPGQDGVTVDHHFSAPAPGKPEYRR